MCRKIFLALAIGLFGSVASAGQRSFGGNPFMDTKALTAVQQSQQTNTSEPSAPLSYLVTEQAPTFAQGIHRASKWSETAVDNSGLTPSNQPAINDFMSPTPDHENYALVLSGVGVMSILAIRRRRLD